MRTRQQKRKRENEKRKKAFTILVDWNFPALTALLAYEQTVCPLSFLIPLHLYLYICFFILLVVILLCFLPLSLI